MCIEKQITNWKIKNTYQVIFTDRVFVFLLTRAAVLNVNEGFYLNLKPSYLWPAITAIDRLSYKLHFKINVYVDDNVPYSSNLYSIKTFPELLLTIKSNNLRLKLFTFTQTFYNNRLENRISLCIPAVLSKYKRHSLNFILQFFEWRQRFNEYDFLFSKFELLPMVISLRIVWVCSTSGWKLVEILSKLPTANRSEYNFRDVWEHNHPIRWIIGRFVKNMAAGT